MYIHAFQRPMTVSRKLVSETYMHTNVLTTKRLSIVISREFDSITRQ